MAPRKLQRMHETAREGEEYAEQVRTSFAGHCMATIVLRLFPRLPEAPQMLSARPLLSLEASRPQGNRDLLPCLHSPQDVHDGDPSLQEPALEDIEALGGDIPAPLGPQQGSNATWDGGGGPPGVAAFSLRNQLGVFEGYSDDDDFNWSLISSREPQLDPQNPSSGPPPDERHLPQVDGAGDDSASADSVPDSASERDHDRECEHSNEAGSHGRPCKRAEVGPALGAGRLRVNSADSQQTDSSSQRFGGLALQKASPSTHSAPAGLHAAGDTAAAQGGEQSRFCKRQHA